MSRLFPSVDQIIGASVSVLPMNMSLSTLQEMMKDREACYASGGPWGRKESGMTEQLNNNNKVSQTKT